MNIVVGQSGGPTAVINSSIAGVYAQAKKLGVEHVYGMVHGIEGFLEDKLCDICINLGENRLCKTCRMFPRITQDYGTFAEHTLSFACPEAVRLVLESNMSSYDSFSETRELNDDEYDKEIMELLLKGRQNTINILT